MHIRKRTSKPAAAPSGARADKPAGNSGPSGYDDKHGMETHGIERTPSWVAQAGS